MIAMDYEALCTIGYNTSDQTFSMITLSNMGTGTLFLQGKRDEGSRSVVLKGTLTNPVTQQPIDVRQMLHLKDKDTLLIESFDQEGNSPEKKTSEYKWVRL